MKHSKLLGVSILFLMLMSGVTALGLGGRELLVRLDYEESKQYEYFYTIYHNDPTGPVDYEIFVQNKKGAAGKFFFISPDYYKDVQPGSKKPLNITVRFFEEPEYPGEHEVRVYVRAKPTEASGGGGISARPVVGVRFFVFVLYPFKYIRQPYDIYTPRLNINESGEFLIKVENLGTPTLNKITADIDIFDSNTTHIKSLTTNTVRNLASREIGELRAPLSAQGIISGKYKAVVNLSWDENNTIQEADFIIGKKFVRVLDYTDLFEVNAINKFEIKVASEWNDPIKELYAKIDVIDNDGKKVASFKSFTTNIDRLKTAKLEAYFDTTGIEIGDYTAIITLFYDGASSVATGQIRIDKDIGAEIVDEIPGKFSIKSLFPEKITTLHIMTALLIIFSILLVILLAMNFYLVFKTIKKNDNEIDEEVIKHVAQLKKKYNEKYIKKLMIQKGWSQSQIEIIFKRAKKWNDTK